MARARPQSARTLCERRRLRRVLLRVRDEHRLGRERIARQGPVGVLRLRNSTGGRAPREVRWARILGSRHGLGEALGRPARAPGTTPMGFLFVLNGGLPRRGGIDRRADRQRLRGPRRRRGRAAHRQAEVDPRLQQIDARPQRCDLAARLAEGQECSSVPLSVRLRNSVRSSRNGDNSRSGPFDAAEGLGRGDRSSCLTRLQEDAHAGLPSGAPASRRRARAAPQTRSVGTPRTDAASVTE